MVAIKPYKSWWKCKLEKKTAAAATTYEQRFCFFHSFFRSNCKLALLAVWVFYCSSAYMLLVFTMCKKLTASMNQHLLHRNASVLMTYNWHIRRNCRTKLCVCGLCVWFIEGFSRKRVVAVSRIFQSTAPLALCHFTHTLTHMLYQSEKYDGVFGGANNHAIVIN